MDGDAIGAGSGHGLRREKLFCPLWIYATSGLRML
jgi:hypothetical protein